MDRLLVERKALHKTIWTVGHSTRTIAEFIGLLKAYRLEGVVDVRTIPRSRKNPQFNKENLEQALAGAGIEYLHAQDLGGLRHAKKDSLNSAWRNDSFRGFADYMQTTEFSAALNWLMEKAEEQHIVLMCAEILPWRCHRSLIADALSIAGYEVIEIFQEEKSRVHSLTPFAVITDGKVTYPATSTTEEV